MKTSDLEKLLGLSKHTIRYYEKEGFIQPHRDENGYRDYRDEDVQTLKLVKFLRSLEISIDDVKAILSGDLNFQECLKMNQDYLSQQLESIKEVKQTIDYYQEKNVPLIPALNEFQIQSTKSKLGFQKTTSNVSLGRKLTRSWACLLYTSKKITKEMTKAKKYFTSIDIPKILKLSKIITIAL